MGEMRNAGSILVREPERTSQFGRAGRKWIKKKEGTKIWVDWSGSG